jgi:hypothetical protein
MQRSGKKHSLYITPSDAQAVSDSGGTIMSDKRLYPFCLVSGNRMFIAEIMVIAQPFLLLGKSGQGNLLFIEVGYIIVKHDLWNSQHQKPL